MCPTSYRQTLAAISVLVFESAIAIADGATVIYVDAGAAGASDGTSWVDAYTDLQDALAAAAALETSDIEIWVTAGTYRPDRGTLNRNATFRLLDGVALYGGFVGVESSRTQRDPSANVTILNGDLLGNDALTLDSTADNSFHVVDASFTGDSAVIDGFTIVAGNSDTDGGGLYCDGGSPVIRQCVFARNVAYYTGGAVACQNPGAPAIIDCVFLENSAVGGNAVASRFLNNLSILNSRFLGNEPWFAGIAIGGAIYAGQSSEVTIANTEFSGNVALLGGAIFIEDYALLTLTNSTIHHNYADDTGAIFVNGSVLTLDNSILWGNPVDIQLGYRSGDVDVRGSCVGEDPLFVDADGADNILGTLDDDVRLVQFSPCVDRGVDELLPDDWADLDGDGLVAEPLPVDLKGGERIGGLRVDAGAYEFGDCNLNGKDDATDILDGTSLDSNSDGVPDECQCMSNGECQDDSQCTDDTCVEHNCVRVRIAGCCSSDDDCLDANACTSDVCVESTCQHWPIERCCSNVSQCITDDPCLFPYCVFNKCVYVPISECGLDESPDRFTDSDGDGVSDGEDVCPDTPDGAEADAAGCSCGQLDEDRDGVDDCRDECANTPRELEVDDGGCPIDEESNADADQDNEESLSAEDRADDDGDGVANYLDDCPETAAGRRRDARGCSCDQRDRDDDEVADCDDLCPGTEADAAVNRFGCSCAQLDGDGDGVNDCDDQCPQTRIGQSVDDQGCPPEDLLPATAEPPAAIVAPTFCGAMGLIPLAMMFAGLAVMGLVSASGRREWNGRQ